MTETKKLSAKALSKSFHNWYYGNLTCFSQEHMQTFGYLVSMLPLVEELYAGDEERKAAMVSNLMVVLCADESAQPVVNTGSLY